MKLSAITHELESIAPLSLQESYDNSGLILGHPDMQITGIMTCLDLTETVIDEAIRNNCNLIVSHHPLIFQGLKNLNPVAGKGKLITSLIKNDLAAYAIHTNLDNAARGLNLRLAEKIGLKNPHLLQPQQGLLRKLVTFCPLTFADVIRKALGEAGAGSIGQYDFCTFSTEGTGTFRASANANPFVGRRNSLHTENETRIETVFPAYLQRNIIDALLKVHPYEEVAYDIYSLNNDAPLAGAGMIGTLPAPMTVSDFLTHIKKKLALKTLSYAPGSTKTISRVAVCGGSGGFLLPAAQLQGADAFITGDLKYHDFQENNQRLLLVDAGHYETEIHVKEILKVALSKKFPNFVILTAKREKNPVHYL